MGDAAFELAGVSKRFGAVDALQSTTLLISRRQTTVLIGPSGCGKSTLLKLLNGLLVPSAGEVRFIGERVTEQNAPGLRRKIGYVVQGGGLFPHLTAEHNVTLMARYLGWESPRIDARVTALADLTQLKPETLARFPLQLSGGQAQRVSLMRALMLDPEVLLLDEPLGALDPITRFDLQRDLREVFSRLQKTVVLVTHDLGEAAYFSDHLVLMRDGRIVQQGNLRDIANQPADSFVAQFLQAQRLPVEVQA